MNVRRYVAPTMRGAMDMVRQTQGSDVVILSNRNIEGGVEVITAAGEMDQAMLASLSGQRVPTNSTSVPARDNESRLWTNPELLQQMQHELGALKNLVEHQLSGFAWHDFETRNPIRARLLRTLTDLGLTQSLARDAVTSTDSAIDDATARGAALDHLSMRVNCINDPLRHGGRLAFCGSTGVGKTTLASKLAARFALTHGPEHVALVSADDQRLGAHHQLATLGRLLGIQVDNLRHLTQLPACFDALAHKTLVLVDLPGYPPHDPNLQRVLTSLRDTSTPLQSYFVAAATTDYLTLSRMLKALGDFGFDAVCLTKLDEAASLGAAVSMLIETQLPLAYVSAGQQIPDDLQSMTRDELMRRLWDLGEQYALPLLATPSASFVNHYSQGAH